MFSRFVEDYWHPTLMALPSQGPDVVHIVVDAELPPGRRAMLWQALHGPRLLRLHPDVAELLGAADGGKVSAAELAIRMASAGLDFHGEDSLFYFGRQEQLALCSQSTEPGLRQLSGKDVALFRQFSSASPVDEFDEAFVELDHWLVYGYFVDETLACVASLIRWSGTRFVDMGVITAPGFRRQGLASKLVCAISAHAIRLGHEPQFRCRPDNPGSLALAQSSGLTLFGSWHLLGE